MTSEGQSISPNDWRLGVWRSFLTAHARINDVLANDLATKVQMPLPWYDVLVQLTEAPERRLRMAQLAENVLLSRSGLSRLVDRLEREGLVSREPYPGDARGTYTVLTREGLARLREATPVHLSGVNELWLSRFNDDELRSLGEMLDRVVEAASADRTSVGRTSVGREPAGEPAGQVLPGRTTPPKG
ncbi:MarR family transcriptional regulator [Jatrophihabitans sp. GAS493]|uniref:MarR family winged helix-turn-helix transcriptional regulator n=1 Tax=Jatrophihabitans sp. GAS493 TaxID=1907575 RepID=UPI000BB7B9B4|nr:MarR family transcriptional regulator [Jatrophihabitans sp. GAS493]SOD73031.1 MarR family transcriptional regulator [Jatrophihabitans sp. GAS493]